MLYIIADNQELTRLGIEQLCHRIDDAEVRTVDSKSRLTALLQLYAEAIVVIDFTLFDFNDVEELIMMAQRFRDIRWVLISEEMTDDFVSRISAEGTAFSLVGKQCAIYEIDQALHCATRGQRYVSNAIMEQLLSVPHRREMFDVSLTKTEKEILREISQGKTTKEIAVARYSSFHTVNTHRKNIFRKLKVNTAYEATRYALRAGLIDSAEYYI